MSFNFDCQQIKSRAGHYLGPLTTRESAETVCRLNI